jgi:hypothetical protein
MIPVISRAESYDIFRDRVKVKSPTTEISVPESNYIQTTKYNEH